MDRQYYAAKEGKEVVTYLTDTVQGASQYYRSTGLFEKIKQSHDTYYGNHFRFGGRTSGTSIGSGGRQGELKLVSANIYRNILRHLIQMITSQKPAFGGKATTSDPEALLQAKLAAQIIPALITQYKVDEALYSTAEASMVVAEGYLAVRWSMEHGKGISSLLVTDEQGQVVMDDDSGIPKQKIIKEGDLRIKHIPRTDVYMDMEVDCYEDNQWVLWREKINKYDIAAQNPHLADLIYSLPAADDSMENSPWNRGFSNQESPYVYVWNFYHKKSDALPRGRMLVYINEDIILSDGPNPYSKYLPLFRMVPSKMIASQRGYTDGFDLLPLQQVYDTIYSSVFTNQSTFGVQSILVPETCNLNATQVSQGMVFLKYNPAGGKPEPLNLTSTPAELFNMLKLTEHLMETISGVNSVARGSPETSLKSGVALGLLQSMAIQYASGFQKQWVSLNEDVATFILKLFQSFATNERFIAVAGRDQRSYIKPFRGSDLDKVDQITVELANPLSQTIAGRAEKADKLLTSGLINLQQYEEVSETGRLDQDLKPSDSMQQLIHQENDDLMRGIHCVVLPTDNDELHLQEHNTLYNDQEVRRDPSRRQALDQHCMDHKQSWAQKQPVDGMLLKQNPMPQPPPMPPPEPQGPPPGPPMQHVMHHQAPPMVGPAMGQQPPAPPPLPQDAHLYAPNTVEHV